MLSLCFLLPPSVLQPQFPRLRDEGGGLDDLIPWPALSGSVTDHRWVRVLEKNGDCLEELKDSEWQASGFRHGS